MDCGERHECFAGTAFCNDRGGHAIPALRDAHHRQTLSSEGLRNKVLNRSDAGCCSPESAPLTNSQQVQLRIVWRSDCCKSLIYRFLWVCAPQSSRSGPARRLACKHGLRFGSSLRFSTEYIVQGFDTAGRLGRGFGTADRIRADRPAVLWR